MDIQRIMEALLLTIALVPQTMAVATSSLTGFTAVTDPPGGSVITAFDYQQHIEIVCSITDNGNALETIWTIHTASDLNYGGPPDYSSGSGESEGGSGGSGESESGSGGSGDDLPPEIKINPDNDPRFSIEGPGGSRLIIDLFGPELNGSVVYCREPLFRELVTHFILRSTPITVVTDPEPGPIVVEEFTNVSILCDIQHENVNAQQWVVEGRVLPDEGNDQFVISGPHQNRLMVLNFTEALDGTVIMCQIAFHGNLHIAQFSLHVDRGEFPLRAPGVEYEIDGEDCSAVDTTDVRQEISGYIRPRLEQFATRVKQVY